MTFGIVTGFTGAEHITPYNLKALNAGIAGSGDYVLKVGKQFKASMLTSNKLRVLDGYGVMGGAQFGMEAGEYVDLTIDNGTQGMRRTDLVVARYERAASTGVESVSLRVIKGTPASGSPSVPAHADGDILAGAAVAEMPLYKISLNGLTVSAPVAMFDVLMPSKEAWDSVAHGVGTVNQGWTIGHFDLERHGRIVTCSMEIAYYTLATLGGAYARVPEGFRPAAPLDNAPVALADGVNCCVGLASISTDGYVTIKSNGVRVNQVLASLTWVA